VAVVVVVVVINASGVVTVATTLYCFVLACLEFNEDEEVNVAVATALLLL